ncbi:MAG: cytochrome b N-terminal domain-containing protein [Candidatus Parvarchaeota archaeon]|nr:cytochrome b N-terminal domain-containing protein [Candidatus Parvarchaeota archaeon]MCW1294741.1 cytochrome b N-terminal domain-containing protein [Candidatus Parvarchaeum tengchongense]MCW1295331.1 cytochrome b N-terminal domain-containing protein [Candidatus Parvarchaeum tengchongense]MCW1312617.1 cytochrome b N-terminal domain-containing protein [Candidatus Parvarchaeum tengchongense]
MDKDKKDNSSFFSPLIDLMHDQYIKYVPSYGNSFFFTIGIYLLELFVILAISGMIMLIFGPYWWDTTAIGTFFRSLHLWAAEAFVTLMFIHLFVNFSTSAFRKKKLVWMIGSVLLLLVLLEFAFGIGVQGGLLSQWNDKAGADLWNGMGLGFWVNPLNQGAVLGWHVAIIPILLILLMFMHYSLVKKDGLSTPYRDDIPYKMVEADHKKMYRRMIYIFIIVLVFAFVFSSPYIAPLTISQAANSNPSGVATTLLQEFNFSSGTATYLDTIDPYTFSTRAVYFTVPYSKYVNFENKTNELSTFFNESPSQQNAQFIQAYDYFSNNGSISSAMSSQNPLIVATASLTKMAESGEYQLVVQNESSSGLDETYVLRFLYDTGALTTAATNYGLRTAQWGMLKVGAPPWSIEYWLIPYNALEIATANIPWWNDLENGLIAIIIFFILMLFPFIPYLNKLPDKLKMYKLFWNKYTNPEMRKKK